ncbi:MAG: hydantoinase B/oxoprolinase family protein, partial [Chloroflexota bacterium]
PINSTTSVVMAGVSLAVIGLTDPHMAINEGCFRPLKIVVPEGTWLNARHPAPRQHCTHETGHKIVDVVLGALAKALPDRVPAAMMGTSAIMIINGYDGRSPAREFYVMLECIAGGFGARPNKDGIDGIRTAVGGQKNIPVEVAEVEYPLVTDWYELVTDSGGPGRYRGGGSLRRVMRLANPDDTKAMGICVCERTESQPYGLVGGKPGMAGRWRLTRKDGSEEKLRGKDNRWLEPGDAFEGVAPGGGGWGNPFEREVDAVLRDVVDERVSPAAAMRDYGVAIDPVTGVVDWERTHALRAATHDTGMAIGESERPAGAG